MISKNYQLAITQDSGQSITSVGVDVLGWKFDASGALVYEADWVNVITEASLGCKLYMQRPR